MSPWQKWVLHRFGEAGSNRSVLNQAVKGGNHIQLTVRPKQILILKHTSQGQNMFIQVNTCRAFSSMWQFWGMRCSMADVTCDTGRAVQLGLWCVPTEHCATVNRAYYGMVKSWASKAYEQSNIPTWWEVARQSQNVRTPNTLWVPSESCWASRPAGVSGSDRLCQVTYITTDKEISIFPTRCSHKISLSSS